MTNEGYVDCYADFKKESEIANILLNGEWDVKKVYDGEDIDTGKGRELYVTGFIPNGKCGCIVIDDDYLFGIRCNHLMWMEGKVRKNFLVKHCGAEPDDSLPEHCCVKCLMVFGNHKGIFMMNLVYPLKLKPLIDLNLK